MAQPRISSIKEETEVNQLHGGIDVGSERHHVIIITDTGNVLYDRKVEHRFSELKEAVMEFRAIERREHGKITFAIEGKNGYGAPFDRMILDEGFTLYNIDNLKLRRFRDVFGAEWRNDRRDAKMLAKMMKLKDHVDAKKEKAFITVEKTPEANERLKILSRHQQGLIDEKTRMQNRLKKRLLEICPDILDYGDTDSKKLLHILKKYPDFRAYKKLTLEKLLKIKTIGKKTASSMIEGLRGIQHMTGMEDEYKTIIESYSRRILELKEEIKQLDEKLEEAGCGSFEVSRVSSIKGVGTKLSSRLIGEIGDIGRFQKESQLAVYCGVTCIDDDSGKKKQTKAVYKANKICKATMIALAGSTIRYVPESRAYYEKKRAEGKDHNHALRCLARQLIKVIFKMLTENRDYHCREDIKKAA